MRRAELFVLGIVLASFLVGIYIYPSLPERIVSHWNAAGQPDGYMDRFWGAYLMPFISAGLFLLFLAIPRIDPKRANIEKFRPYFDRFIILLFGFLLYIYLLTLLWNLGWRFDFVQLLVPPLAAIFYYSGVLIENAKQNWFIGIRTPWTLSSENVWDSTHKLGGKLFKISGIIALLGVVLKEYAFLFILLPVLSAGFYSIVYSYLEYQKETRAKRKR